MQYYDGDIYFVHNGCLYKNDTAIITSGKVNDAFVSERGIYYLSENSYIALYNSPLYCEISGVNKLAYYPGKNWFAAYNHSHVYIIRPNCTVFKKYQFSKAIFNTWMLYDYDLSQLYLFISCGHHLYITDGLKKRHFYCTDIITAGSEDTVCHSTGFYIRSYLTKERAYLNHRFFSDVYSLRLDDIRDAAAVCNIITGCPVQKAFYLEPQYLTMMEDYGCVVIFSSGSNLYLLVMHYDGKAYALQIATSVDDWIVINDDNRQYFLYIRRAEHITRCNLNRELSYIIYADPDKKIPHYPENYITLEWKDCTYLSIKQIGLIHSLLRALKAALKALANAFFVVIERILDNTPAIFEFIKWYIIFAIITGIIKMIIFK